MSQDLIELLSALLEKEVEFLVVGGVAVSMHSEPRYTKDIDVLIRNSADTQPKLELAFRSFGIPTQLLSGFFQPDEAFVIVGVEPNRIDFLNSIPGVDFEACWPNRTYFRLDGIDVPFIGHSDLIVAKRASGRPRDLIDAENLERMLRLKSQEQAD